MFNSVKAKNNYFTALHFSFKTSNMQSKYEKKHIDQWIMDQKIQNDSKELKVYFVFHKNQTYFTWMRYKIYTSSPFKVYFFTFARPFIFCHLCQVEVYQRQSTSSPSVISVLPSLSSSQSLMQTIYDAVAQKFKDRKCIYELKCHARQMRFWWYILGKCT